MDLRDCPDSSKEITFKKHNQYGIKQPHWLAVAGYKRVFVALLLLGIQNYLS